MAARNVLLAMIVTVVLLGCFMAIQANARPIIQASGLAPGNLGCEYLVNPLGIGTTKPRLSWTVQSNQRGQVQSAYRILVASNLKLLGKDMGDLWDSGKVASDRSNQIVYQGAPLKSRVRCYWKVRVWDKQGQPSAWSERAGWTMGLLDPNDWEGKWIGFDASRKRDAQTRKVDLTKAKWIWYPEADTTGGAPVATRYFRTEFLVPEGRQLVAAPCAVAADNSFKMFLNGRRIRNGNNFKQAVEADVKENLLTGKNVLAIEANNEGEAPNPAGVIAILSLQFADGQSVNVISDGTWRASDTGGANWMNVDFDAGKWPRARVIGDYGTEPWGDVSVVPGDLFLPPAQLLRKQFVLEKPIERATVYASALGNYELYVNGRRVGNAYFTPGWTDYNKRVYYNTFDVTDAVAKGFNVIGAILADGWYSGHIGWMHIRDHYGKDPRFLAQLHVEYTDGTSKIIATDKTWIATTGPIVEGDFLMGETYDARKEVPGWSTPYLETDKISGRRASKDRTESAFKPWQPVDVSEDIAAKIEAYPGVLVREFQQIRPVSIAEPEPGAYVYSMGTNFAGFVRLKVSGAKPGQKIVLRFAERLNPDGTIYTTNLRGARATDTYICKGSGTEVWRPRFTFHGFQYVEVTGYPGKPNLDTILGVELTSSTPVAGHFECSDPMANTLYHNICQTQRANFIDIPTDCPQRDERLGWMGDAQIYVRTATYNTDVSAFFTKWLVDVEDAQGEDGNFSDVSPRKVAVGGGTAAWGDAGVICPWTIYQVYGDTRVLAEHYDAMTKWIEYCKGTSPGLLRPAEGYGDWLSIKADTPKDVLATAYFARSTKLVAQAAAVLGKEDDARKYEQLFDEIAKAFNDAYVAADGRIKGDTQTVYVLALAFDLLPESSMGVPPMNQDHGQDARATKRELAAKYLVDDIRNRNWHLSTGFVGTKDLMATLTRFGATDVAYHLFHNETFPSWGFSIKQGATSIWERWDGWTPENGFQDPGMNSFAHYSFGAVGEWMFKTIGGIDTQDSGYQHIIIHPQPGGRLSWARTSYDSIQGPISTAWRIAQPQDRASARTLVGTPFKSDTFILDVEIPANTVATVYVPARDVESVIEGRGPAARARGVKPIGMQGNAAVFEVGSGTYHFASPLP